MVELLGLSFCAKCGWNWPSGSGELDEDVKSLRKQRQQENDDRQQTNFVYKSLHEQKAQVSL